MTHARGQSRVDTVSTAGVLVGVDTVSTADSPVEAVGKTVDTVSTRWLLTRCQRRQVPIQTESLRIRGLSVFMGQQNKGEGRQSR